jgi:hypothetical protein
MFDNKKNDNRQQQDLRNSEPNKKIHWDAETVDYEEIKEDKK